MLKHKHFPGSPSTEGTHVQTAFEVLRMEEERHRSGGSTALCPFRRCGFRTRRCALALPPELPVPSVRGGTSHMISARPLRQQMSNLCMRFIFFYPTLQIMQGSESREPIGNEQTQRTAHSSFYADTRTQVYLYSVLGFSSQALAKPQLAVFVSK